MLRKCIVALAYCYVSVVSSAVYADTIVSGDLQLRDGGRLYFPGGSYQDKAQMVGPKGDTGPAGPANTLAIGNVATGNPGTAAGASVTGISPNQTLNLLLPQGPTGPQGVQGLKGDTGATGSTGAQGIQGIKGDTGAAGPTGITWRGAWNNTTAYSLRDAVVYNGASYICVAINNIGFIPTNTSYWTVLAQKGDTGVAGPQGLQGVKGDAGAQGLQGIQGIKGDIGATGLQGLKGDTGSLGPQGIQGAKGDTGVQGPIGSKGDTGATGPQGIQGVKGDTGLTGPSGPAGSKGDTGAQGLQGIQGVKGDIGATGPQGAQGLQGIQGPQGGAGTVLTWRGTFDPLDATGYAANDMIQYAGNAWIAASAIYKECLAYSTIYFNGHPILRCTSYAANWVIPGSPEGAAWNVFATGGVGPQGPAGPQGAKGDTGAQGTQGLQGLQGIQGQTGPQGPAGNAAIIGGHINSDGTIAAGSGFTSTIYYSPAPAYNPYYSITLPAGYNICTANVRVTGPLVSVGFSSGPVGHSYLSVSLDQLNSNGTLWISVKGDFYFICTKSN